MTPAFTVPVFLAILRQGFTVFRQAARYSPKPVLVFGALFCFLCTSAQTKQRDSIAHPQHNVAARETEASMLTCMDDSGRVATLTMDSLFKQTSNELHFLRTALTRYQFTERDSARLRKSLAGFQLPHCPDWRIFCLKNTPAKENLTSYTPLLQFNGAYICYNWNYRSGLDSPYTGLDLAQHQLTACANITLANRLPLKVSYYGRKTNSPLFRDYQDVSVDVDVQRYQQLRSLRAQPHFKKLLAELRNPLLEFAVPAADLRVQQYRNMLQEPSLVNALISSKEVLLRKNFPDTSRAFMDSIYTKAAHYIQFYDSLQQLEKRYVDLKDSLHQQYQQTEATIKKVEQLANSKALSPEDAKAFADLAGSQYKTTQSFDNGVNGIRKFALGRTYPNYSNLTLQNVSIKGVNFIYEKNHLHFGIAAGSVDFRIRDFLFAKQNKEPQFVLLTRVGLGSSARDNIILTYFTGKKQLPGSSLEAGSVPIQGLTLSGQLFVNRYTRIYGELAQAAVPALQSPGPTQKSSFQLSDRSQQAYALGIASNIPRTQTRLDGYYQHQGVNYQCFNGYQYNGATESWSGKLEQSFLKRRLTLLAAMRKNDFSNPYVLQRYSANTIFKSLNLTFQKPRWPVVSFGYLPVSQNTYIGNQVYENHFQSLSAMFTHQYPLGLAKGTSAVVYNRFYNESSDSGFVYFNAKNVFWNQSFIFPHYTTGVGASVLKSTSYRLYVLEGNLNANLLKGVPLDIAMKINTLNEQTTKLGFRTGVRLSINNIGELNLWTERSYVPTMQSTLYKYEVYSLAFSRYFK